jgi:hypothetical protein
MHVAEELSTAAVGVSHETGKYRGVARNKSKLVRVEAEGRCVNAGNVLGNELATTAVEEVKTMFDS